MKYTVDYFIKKFEKTAEADWCIEDFQMGETMCANGHCGVFKEHMFTEESEALKELLSKMHVHWFHNSGQLIEESTYGYSIVAALINDGKTIEYRQPTPKQRILAALYDIKAMQQKEAVTKEKIVYVAVPVTITEQAKELVMS